MNVESEQMKIKAEKMNAEAVATIKQAEPKVDIP
jgi:hypothetical protein